MRKPLPPPFRFYANPPPPVQPIPSGTSATQLSAQVNNILQTLFTPSKVPSSMSPVIKDATPSRHEDAPPSRQEDVPESPAMERDPEPEKVSPPGPETPGPLGTLSIADIRRIREKKQKLQEKKQAERELAKREAMYMRDELNKSIKKIEKKDSSNVTKKPKTTSVPVAASPESSSSSSSSGGHTQKNLKPSPIAPPKPSLLLSKPLFSLDQPASTQVLNDVALALLDGKPETSSGSSTRPTGVVTPTPRPVHPVFMQSGSGFPLVETSTSQDEGNSSSDAPNTRSQSQVLSEIDTTLSILKQGLQGDRNDNELKDSTAKLLQLVLKLGGASSTEIASQPQEADISNSAASLSQFLSDSNRTDVTAHSTSNIPSDGTSMSTSEHEDLRATLNARNEPRNKPSGQIQEQPGHSSDSGTTTQGHRRVPLSDLVQTQVDSFSSSLNEISPERLNAAGDTRLFSMSRNDAVALSSRLSDEKDSIVRLYRNQVAEIPVSRPSAPSQNIDEILKQLRPYIETVSKIKAGERSPRQEKVTLKNPITSTSDPAPVGNVGDQKPTRDQPAVVIENAPPMPVPKISPIQHAPTIVVPIPITQHHPPTNPIPISQQPLTNPSPNIAFASQQVGYNEPQVQVIPAPAPIIHPTGHIQTVQPPSNFVRPPPGMQPPHPSHNVTHYRSDGGTPTLDERFPDPVKKKKRKRKRVSDENKASSANSFLVFDPTKSLECEGIRAYLIGVNGLPFDIVKMRDTLHLAIKRALDMAGCSEQIPATVLDMELLTSLLPPGNLWVVVRTPDLIRIDSLPQLSLLKSAGPRVQFVCADSVREVKARQYHYILAGDGGLVVPLALKTLLEKPTVFRHLMLWLVGQRGDGNKSRRWKIALHQHLLNALQTAENSMDEIERQNADQVLEWLCHAGNKKSKLAEELPDHQCDQCPSIDLKSTVKAWNWYDIASDSELAQAALPCAIKLQQDYIRQSRHIVVLVDSDPVAPCWQPLWQSGICVSTMERFVDMVCSKPSGSVSQQSTCCVLPLYSVASAYL